MLQGNPVKRLNHREILGGFFVFGDDQFPSCYGGVPKGRGGYSPKPSYPSTSSRWQKAKKKLGPTKRRAKVKAMYANQFLLPKVRLKTKTDLGIITIPGGSIGRN